MGGGPERNPTGSTDVINGPETPVFECERSFLARTNPVPGPDLVASRGPVRQVGKNVAVKVADELLILLKEDLPAGFLTCLARGFDYEGTIVPGTSADRRVEVRSVR